MSRGAVWQRPVCTCTPRPPGSSERAQTPRRILPGSVPSQLGAALSRSPPATNPLPATHLQSAAVRKGLQDSTALCRAHRAGALQAHAAVARQGGRESASRGHGGKENKGGAHCRAQNGGRGGFSVMVLGFNVDGFKGKKGRMVSERRVRVQTATMYSWLTTNRSMKVHPPAQLQQCS